jgi:hypothetical protein
MTFAPCALPPLLNNRSTIWFDARFKFARNAFQENALCAIIEEAHMPLSPEQEALCERLEKGESTPNAAALIRQQAHEIDDLWDRLLSRAHALVRRVSRGNDPRGDGAVAGYA